MPKVLLLLILRIAFSASLYFAVKKDLQKKSWKLDTMFFGGILLPQRSVCYESIISIAPKQYVFQTTVLSAQISQSILVETPGHILQAHLGIFALLQRVRYRFIFIQFIIFLEFIYSIPIIVLSNKTFQRFRFIHVFCHARKILNKMRSHNEIRRTMKYNTFVLYHNLNNKYYE